MTTNRMGLEQTLSDEQLELLITSLIISTAVAQQTQSFAPSFATQNELQVAALRELLARRKASREPVAWTDSEELRDANSGGCGYLFPICGSANKFADPRRQIMLYAAPAGTVPDGWIKFSEQAPPLRTPLLVCSGNGVVQLTLYGFDGEHWQDWYEEFDPIKVDRFDWWQLLPTEPKR